MSAAWSSVLAEAGLPGGLVVSARRLEEREARPRLPSGFAALDGLLGGGWPRGALSELAGLRSSGRTTLLYTSIAGALAAGETVALVDVGGGLDPRNARRAGLELGGLLWVRCQADQALGAAELVLGAGGFGLVAIDLGEGRGRAPMAAWMRLKRTAEQQGAAVVVAAPRRPEGAQGACAVELRARRPRFLGDARTGAPALFMGWQAEAALTRALRRGEEAARAVAIAFSRAPRGHALPINVVPGLAANR